MMPYNIVNTLAPSFVIDSSALLHVTWAAIKYRMSANFCQIRLRSAELAALERLEKSHRLAIGEML